MTASGRRVGLNARAVVRVLDGPGEVVGAGFLVGPDLVATCAHVVSSAVGVSSRGAPPAGVVRVDFPLAGGTDDLGPPAVDASVERWSPVQPDGTGDVALLRLDRPAPPGVVMPPLRRVDALWGHRYRVLGFPDGMDDGVWATGVFRGEQGTRWLQLQGTPGDQPIEEGFSGSPVWDDATGAVVGMTVGVDASGASTTAYLIPVEAVLGLDPELLPCPYRGLEPFGEDHTAFFFGRDADVARLAAAAGRQPLVVVAGMSGAGKSSLVRAGLLPQLRVSGVQIAECRPAVDGEPVTSLAGALVATRHPGLATAAQARATAELAAQLAGSDEVRRAAVARLVAEASGDGLVMFVDQFEELAGTDPEAAQALLSLIVELVRAAPAAHDEVPPVRALLTVRWESLNDLLTPDLVGTLEGGTVLVPPMGRAQLREAIVRPAERAPGLYFEDGLVERILDDAGAEPGQLTLVESLLTELWERRDGGCLTVAAYEAAGGVAGAVTKRAEQLIAELGEPGDLERVRRVFTLLARPDRDGNLVRRPVGTAELAPELRELVPRLAAARLVVLGQTPDGAEQVELAHQALIEHWPRLRRWLTQDRDFLAWQAQLDGQLESWQAGGRDQGALLRGSQLAAAHEWLTTRAGDVSGAQREYVQLSQARQRREVRRWRVVTAVLAVLVLAAGVLAAAAVDRGNRLDRQLATANARALGQEAAARARQDPVTATQLALAAWRADPASGEARTALARQYVAMRSAEAVFADLADQPITRFQLSADGSAALVGHAAGLAVVTGLSGPAPQRWVPPGLDARSLGALSPDGHWLATVDAGGTVRIWDVRARGEPEVLHPGQQVSVAGCACAIEFAPDSARLVTLSPAAAGAGHDLQVFDVATRAAVPHGLGVLAERDIAGVWLTPDPGLLLVRHGDSTRPDSRLVVRPLSGGVPVRAMPAESSVVQHGAAVLSCAPADPNVPSGASSAAVVTRTDSGAEQLRYPLLASLCGPATLRQTADRTHAIRPLPGSSDTSDYRRIRVTNLADGASFDLDVPPTDDSLDLGLPTAKVDLAPTTGVFRGSDGRPTVLLAAGRSVVRMRDGQPPLPGGNGWETIGRGGERHLVGRERDDYVVRDAATGAELGRRPRASMTGGSVWASPTVDADSFGLLTRPAANWILTSYSLPQLVERGRYVLPAPAGSTPGDGAAGARVGDRLITVSGGLVAVWDTRSFAMIGEPLQLGSTPEDRQWHRLLGSFHPRPGHPDQIAVLARDGSLQLWDVLQRRQVGSIPTRIETPPAARVAFDRSGDRVVIVAAGNRIELWDVTTGARVSEGLPAPASTGFLGFTGDGYLVTVRDDRGQVVELWDLAKGGVSGSVRPGHVIRPETSISDDGRLEVGGRTDLPVYLDTAAQQWFDGLCRIADREFTDAERRALPAGTRTDRPCA